MNLYFPISVLSLVALHILFFFLFSYFPPLFFILIFHVAIGPDSAQGSSSVGGRSSGGHDSSSVWFPPPYDIDRYLQEYRAYVDTDFFARFPSTRIELTVRFGVSVLDNAAGAWRKRSKHLGDRG